MPGLPRKVVVVPLMIAAAAGTPLLAAAADVIKARIANYRQVGVAFKNVNDQLRSDSPQLFIIQMAAREISKASKEQFNWFPAGSGPEAGVKTRAKSVIWANPAQFKAAQNVLVQRADAFTIAAKSGDIGKIKAAARELGGACKGCHSKFREDE